MNELTITLPVENWNFILEVLNLNSTMAIKNTAINMIKPELDRQFEEKKKSVVLDIEKG